MPTWRCPHCGTPQTETARCWVCRRSSTACGTCRHFRRSVAAQLGYCGLDRRRAPLAGDEIRACWEAAPIALTAAPTGMPAPASPHDPAAVPGRLEFVEVGTTSTETSPPAADGPTAADLQAPAAAARPPEPGWNLWGDLEA